MNNEDKSSTLGLKKNYNPGSGRALRSSCSSTATECADRTCRESSQLIGMMLQNALCLCEGIYNPAITTQSLYLSLYNACLLLEFSCSLTQMLRERADKVPVIRTGRQPLYLDIDLTLCLYK